MECPHCGAQVENGYAKCANCRRLVAAPAAAGESAQAAAPSGGSVTRSTREAVPRGSAPSRTATIVATIFLGVFGAFFASHAANRARASGHPPEPYWKAFWVTLAITIGAGIALYAIVIGLLLAAAQSSTPSLAGAPDTLASSTSEPSAAVSTPPSPDPTQAQSPALLSWDSSGAVTSSGDPVVGARGVNGAPPLPYDNTAGRSAYYLSLVDDARNYLPAAVFTLADGSGCSLNVHGIPRDASVGPSASGKLNFGCIPPGTYTVASVAQADVDDPASWSFAQVEVTDGGMWAGACVRSPRGANNVPWSLPEC